MSNTIKATKFCCDLGLTSADATIRIRDVWEALESADVYDDTIKLVITEIVEAMRLEADAQLNQLKRNAE